MTSDFTSKTALKLLKFTTDFYKRLDLDKAAIEDEKQEMLNYLKQATGSKTGFKIKQFEIDLPSYLRHDSDKSHLVNTGKVTMGGFMATIAKDKKFFNSPWSSDQAILFGYYIFDDKQIFHFKSNQPGKFTNDGMEMNLSIFDLSQLNNGVITEGQAYGLVKVKKGKVFNYHQRHVITLHRTIKTASAVEELDTVAIEDALNNGDLANLSTRLPMTVGGTRGGLLDTRPATKRPDLF